MKYYVNAEIPADNSVVRMRKILRGVKFDYKTDGVIYATRAAANDAATRKNDYIKMYHSAVGGRNHITGKPNKPTVKWAAFELEDMKYTGK